MQLRQPLSPLGGVLLASLSLLAAPVTAADDDDNKNNGDSSDSSSSTDDATSSDTATATATDQDKATKTADSSSASTTEASDSTSTSDPTDSATNAFPSLPDSSSTMAFPTLPKSTSVSGSATGSNAIPTYPAPSVPPTQNAPFMRQSNLPDGTVFIAVGAILGAALLAVLLWRIIVGAMLRKSANRAALKQIDYNGGGGGGKDLPPFYKFSDHTSTMSLGQALGAGRGNRRTTRGNIPSSNLSQPNLFFSPTAAVNNQPGNRSSTYLPSGFYAAGSSVPGNQTQSISMTNLPPYAGGHFSDTPPESPYTHARRDVSTSSLNLNLHNPPAGGQQRTPSAYLEDLLADDPTALPPPQLPPSSGLHGSGRSSPAGRF